MAEFLFCITRCFPSDLTWHADRVACAPFFLPSLLARSRPPACQPGRRAGTQYNHKSRCAVYTCSCYTLQCRGTHPSCSSRQPPPAAGRPSRSTVTQQPRPVPLHISPPFLSLYLALSLCQKPAACARAPAPCEACEFLRPRLRLRWQANWRARTHTLAVAASLAWSVARGSSRPSDRASISPARFFTSRSTTTAGGSCLLTA